MNSWIRTDSAALALLISKALTLATLSSSEPHELRTLVSPAMYLECSRILANLLLAFLAFVSQL